MTKDEIKQCVREAVDESTRTLREDVSLLRNWLTGNGSPHKGMLVRFDRLEQSESRRSRIVWLALTAALAAFAQAVFRVVG